jgi:hypothetical protein
VSRTYPLMSITADFTQGPPNISVTPNAQLLPGTAAGGVPACRGWSTTRGRQYELDVVQAGTASLDVVDPAEWLNPVNTGSPWNSGANSLLPYRCVQIAAWWNGATKDVTGNQLNATNFVNGSNTLPYDPSFESGLSGWFGLTGAPVLTTSAAQHFVGAQSMSVTFTGSSDQAVVPLPRCPGGQQFVCSLYVFVPAGHTVTATFANNVSGFPVIASATSSTTAAWERLTMTGVPSAGSTVLLLKVASGTFSATVFVDAMQLEFGSAASAFTTSGPKFYPVYTGYIERYPQQWDSQGFRGLRPLEAVDALSVLSRTVISQSYAATIAADGPSLFIPYDDEAFPQTIQRPLGGQRPIPYQQLGSQSASISFGGDSFLDGSKALTLSQQNTDPVTLQTDTTQVTYVGTRTGPLAVKPAAYTLEMWVRFTSGQAYFGLASMQSGESTIGKPDGPNKFWGFYSAFGKLTTVLFDPNGGSTPLLSFNSASPWNGYPDGKWHYLSIILSGGTSLYTVVDTRYPGGPTSLGFTASTYIGMDNFFVNATSYFGDPVSTIAIANLAAYPTALSAAQAAAHYQRGIGYLGEKSGTRSLRLLTQYWSTNVVTDTGETSMAADFSYSGRSMLDVLQEIADTENGLVWADAAGLVHQDSRETRYTAAVSTTPQFVFGENSGAGELPYAELEYDYDPTFVYSEADLTAGGSGTQLPAIVNATTQTAVGQRVLSKTLQMQNDWDVNQAGLFYVARYAKPAGAAGTGVPPRISKMTLDPAANPNLFAAVLSMDIGTRITVKRRTSAVTISGDYYVEQINHDATGDASSWKTELQLSPVFVPQVWVLGDAVKGVLGSTTVCVY